MRVAVHDVGAARSVQPAVPDPAVLPGEFEQRLRDVGAGVRAEQGQQLDLGAVDVPAGEGAVLGLVALAHGMDLLVAASVSAVGVADDVRVQEGVVERGVEGGAVGVGAAADLDRVELVAPGPVGGVLDVGEGPGRRVLGREVGLGARLTDVRDTDLDVHGAGAGLELHIAARALARDRTPACAESAGAAARFRGTRAQLVVLPGAGRLEVAVEVGGEVEGVVGALALRVEVSAEVPGGHGAGDGAGRRVDLDVRSRRAHFRVGGTDQQRGGLVGGVGEAARARAGGRREVGGDAGGEAHLVVAGLRALVGVREVGCVHRVLGVARG